MATRTMSVELGGDFIQGTLNGSAVGTLVERMKGLIILTRIDTRSLLKGKKTSILCLCCYAKH